MATEITSGMTADERSALERFPVIAEEFCHLIDDRHKRNRKQLVRELAVHLARLCEVAVRLPHVRPATDGVDHAPEEVAAHTQEWAKLSNELRHTFGSFDNYWEFFDPTQKEEPVSCSLAVDIVETYLDLKEALAILNAGAALNDVYWQWRFDFQSHWARHAASALRVMIHISNLA